MGGPEWQQGEAPMVVTVPSPKGGTESRGEPLASEIAKGGGAVISLVSGAFHRSSFGPHSISFGLLAVSFGPLAVYFGLYAVSLDVVDFSSDFFKLFLVNSLTPRVVSSV